MAGAHQHERMLELLVADTCSCRLRMLNLLAGDLIEVPLRQPSASGRPGVSGLELVQLQADAFADGTRADAGGIEALDLASTRSTSAISQLTSGNRLWRISSRLSMR